MRANEVINLKKELKLYEVVEDEVVEGWWNGKRKKKRRKVGILWLYKMIVLKGKGNRRKEERKEKTKQKKYCLSKIFEQI